MNNDSINLNIDGKDIVASPGKMIIEVADEAGIYIPRFCYHEKLSIAANCRMCLIEVENLKKPIPACATPVVEGMRISTKSQMAKNAQKGTMEFLLINHPLDCPVCDQGGECPLQDQAVGYGRDSSRYLENKRVKQKQNLGPLIATAMTRCIHCTRCVRFGSEIAGDIQLGSTGRGENMTIETFLNESIDNEVSGNIIDLCPVGALTSKPYLFTARPWELTSHNAISPHDSFGSNIKLQTVRGKVRRVVPRDNEKINECWISDRDRFAYEGAESPDRLINPLIRKNGRLEEVSWEEALKEAASALKSSSKIVNKNLGAFIHPICSNEEFFLLQKIIRGLGSSNIDHRLLQKDFSDDDYAPAIPGLEIQISDIPSLEGCLLLGCNPRKELPLLAVRLRKMFLNGGSIGLINTYGSEQNFVPEKELLTEPNNLLSALCTLISMSYGLSALPRKLKQYAKRDDLMLGKENPLDVIRKNQHNAIFIGEQILTLRNSAAIKAAATILAERSGSKLGIICAGNSAGAWWAGAVPHRKPAGLNCNQSGLNTSQMLKNGLNTAILYNVEPAIDVYDPIQALEMLRKADSVISFSSFASAIPLTADIAFPIAPYTEHAGSYINCNGKIQESDAALMPKGQSRPGWKVLRVLANFLSLDGFDYVDIEEIRNDIPYPSKASARSLAYEIMEDHPCEVDDRDHRDMIPVGGSSLYSTDPIVRRSEALSSTKDGKEVSVCRIHSSEMNSRNFKDGDQVKLRSLSGHAVFSVQSDDKILPGCIYISSGHPDSPRINLVESISVNPVGS